MTKETPQQRYNRSHPDVIDRALKRQNASYQKITLRLHKEDDAELIQWLKSQDSTIQQAIKNALYKAFNEV